MKNKIHYSPESRRDLDDIWDYIVSELQNRSAAERVINRIIDAVDPLKNFAEMGTPLCFVQARVQAAQACIFVLSGWTVFRFK